MFLSIEEYLQLSENAIKTILPFPALIFETGFSSSTSPTAYHNRLHVEADMRTQLISVLSQKLNSFAKM